MGLRPLVKHAVGRLALLGPVYAATRRELQRRIDVVYMHYVGEPVPYYDEFYAGSTLDRLDADLTLLGKHFEFAALSDVVSGEARTGKPELAVTFDDGFDMLRNGAADVLERHGVRATSFVITGTVGNEDLMWRNKLSAVKALCEESSYLPAYNRLMRSLGLGEISRGGQLMGSSMSWPMKRKDELADELWNACGMPALEEFLDEHRPYFTWQGLREWVERGHSVGLHTRTHPVCPRLDEEGVSAELIEPGRLLRQRLASAFLPLSYPFGARLDSDAERELLRRGVFDCAFGTNGFAVRDPAGSALERACIDDHLPFSVFGKPLLGRPRPAGGAVASMPSRA